MPSYIELCDVKKTYTMGEVDIHALNGVSFCMEKGELVVVVGPSGAGKSTVLNLLGGMDTPTSGTMIVDGQRIDAMGDRALTLYRRNDVGFVFQFYNLVANLTALENVELATQISKKPFPPRDMMESVGLCERMSNFPAQLSGGEQQRVAIARALAKNPKLLLCDEPTGALDSTTGRQVMTLLQHTCRNYGMTAIIITHNQTLVPMGDRVIHIKNGIVEYMEQNEHPCDAEDLEW
jgi:putative ABC transport system ATP-binding protein